VSPNRIGINEDGRTGGWQVIPADAASRMSYADLAIALLDEIDEPHHHRVRFGVAPR
jgi:putative NADH-flavin reductase